MSKYLLTAWEDALEEAGDRITLLLIITVLDLFVYATQLWWLVAPVTGLWFWAAIRAVIGMVRTTKARRRYERITKGNN